MTDRQKLALSLEKAGYSHARIAEELGIKHRQQVTRLIARGKAARRRFQQAMSELLPDQ